MLWYTAHSPLPRPCLAVAPRCRRRPWCSSPWGGRWATACPYSSTGSAPKQMRPGPARAAMPRVETMAWTSLPRKRCRPKAAATPSCRPCDRVDPGPSQSGLAGARHTVGTVFHCRQGWTAQSTPASQALRPRSWGRPIAPDLSRRDGAMARCCRFGWPFLPRDWACLPPQCTSSAYTVLCAAKWARKTGWSDRHARETVGLFPARSAHDVWGAVGEQLSVEAELREAVRTLDRAGSGRVAASEYALRCAVLLRGGAVFLGRRSAARRQRIRRRGHCRRDYGEAGPVDRMDELAWDAAVEPDSQA